MSSVSATIRKRDVTTWDYECPNTWDGVRTAALLRIAEELTRIRQALDTVGLDGFHEVVRDARDRVRARKKRPRAIRGTRARRASA